VKLTGGSARREAAGANSYIASEREDAGWRPQLTPGALEALSKMGLGVSSRFVGERCVRRVLFPLTGAFEMGDPL
jgi:hypothetical protein